jgi:hypothetical protein
MNMPTLSTLKTVDIDFRHFCIKLTALSGYYGDSGFRQLHETEVDKKVKV